MICVVIGGAASGKSEYAENYAKLCAGSDPLFYVATMNPFGKEGLDRIKKHRKNREGKGFVTIECSKYLKDISECRDGVVLLEDVSNLAANLFFEDHVLTDGIFEQIISLCNASKDIILVTNNIFEDGFSGDEMTDAYIKIMGAINTKLVEIADEAYEIVSGIEVRFK